MSEDKIKTRFAPSPTGRFHVGVARTALFSYLWAKKNSGEFILRIDDTDKERSKQEYEEEIKNGMLWLGMRWDEEFRQSERLQRYMEVAEKLLDEGLAYRCYCSPEELEKWRQEALRRKLNPKYPGTCRDRKDNPSGPYAIRFKVPDDIYSVEFNDLVMRHVKFDVSEIEDFVLVRQNGLPTYNLTSVVDDADYKITHIIRGADHISNTPKQILLFRILGHEPEFAHIPLVYPDEGKGKLSKRLEEKIFRGGERAVSSIYILDLKDEGFLSEAVVNHLARLGWSHGDKEIFSMEELERLFDIKEVGRSPARYNFEKLYWLNSQWIKMLDDNVLLERVKPFLDFDLNKDDVRRKILSIMPEVKIRVKTLRDMADMLSPIFEVHSYDGEAVRKFLNEKGREILSKALSRLHDIDFPSDGASDTKVQEERKKFDTMMRELAEEFGVKVVFVAQTLRVALYGRTVSPPLFEVIKAIGKDEAIKRIKKAMEIK